MKKKAVPAIIPGAQVPVHLAPCESDVLQKFPALLQHCCTTRYDDGDARKPGWFTVKTMGSAWVIQVKDPDACLSLTAIGQNLDDALTMAELLLSGDETPWEPDPFLKRQDAPTKRRAGG